MEVVDPAGKPARAEFAARLIRLREAYGRRVMGSARRMTQIRFAEMLGITQAAYARYEKGGTSPNIGVLSKIRTVTGCSLDSLIAGVQPGSPALLGELVQQPGAADRFRRVRELKDAAESGAIAPEDWAALLRELSRPPTLADRFRWVRQIKEPDEERAAEVLGISVEGLLAIENGTMPPTIEKLIDFATRFGVTTDFLTLGRTAGIRDQDLLLALLDQHPSLGLEPASCPGPGRNKEPGGGNMFHVRKAAQAV